MTFPKNLITLQHNQTQNNKTMQKLILILDTTTTERNKYIDSMREEYNDDNVWECARGFDSVEEAELRIKEIDPDGKWATVYVDEL